MDNYIELAKHCIGLDYKLPYHRHGKAFYRPYRNYFTTGGNGAELDDDWKTLVSAGYAGGTSENDRGIGYWLTREGLDWLGKQINITIYNEED